jgi:hypothetical protein
MSVAPGRSLRLTTPSAVLVALLSAVLLFAASAVVAPGQAFAATATRYAACDGVALRVYAGTTGNLEGRINEGARITIVATVTGGGWRGTCDSSTTTGSRWYRISAVNGKSVSSLYGVRYVYAATGLFRTTATVSATRYAACDDVSLRAYAGTTGMLEGQIETGTAVRVVATVSGGAWKASCAGKSVSGSSWYRISAVDGTSASSLYGRTYVYAATGLFATSAPAVAPDTAPAALSEGIDVSHWQGSVDWDRVRAAGKRFVFLKSSESTDYVDPTYASNRSEARAAGLLVGAYHFAQPGTQSGRRTTSWPPPDRPPATCCRSSTSRSRTACRRRSSRPGRGHSSSGSTRRPGCARSSTSRPRSGGPRWATRPGSPTTATRSCGSRTGRRPPARRRFRARTGAARAGRSGSTARPGRCRGSAAGST